MSINPLSLTLGASTNNSITVTYPSVADATYYVLSVYGPKQTLIETKRIAAASYTGTTTFSKSIESNTLYTVSGHVEKASYPNAIAVLDFDTDCVTDKVGPAWISVGTPRKVFNTQTLSDCLYLDGASGLKSSNRNAWSLGADNWTIEFWYNLDPSMVGSVEYIGFLSRRESWQSNCSFFIEYRRPLADMCFSINNSIQRFSWPWQLDSGAWHHFALVRHGEGEEAGKYVSWYLDGVNQGTREIGVGTIISDYDSDITIGFGDSASVPPLNNALTGYVDELHAQKNVVKYTGNFVPSRYGVLAKTEPLLSSQLAVANGACVTAGGAACVALADIVSAGDDVNTISLLRFDNGLVDECGLVWHNDSATISSVQKFSGTHSLRIDGTSPSSHIYTKLPQGNFSFYHPFTFDFRLYIEEVPNMWGNILINLASRPDTEKRRLLELHYDQIIFARKEGPLVAVSNPLSVGQWHHVAMVGDETTFYVFVDGTLTGSIARTHGDVGNLDFSTVGLGQVIDGADHDGSGIYYIDEFRISKIARWTNNFIL